MAGIFITHFCPKNKHIYGRAYSMPASLGRIWVNWVFAALVSVYRALFHRERGVLSKVYAVAACLKEAAGVEALKKTAKDGAGHE